jgi:predicted MFS family arabinose efflux permease
VLLGLALLVASSLAFAFADSIVLLDAARFLQGVGGAASWAGAMGWVAGAAPRDRRGQMIGTTMGAAVAGTLVGPAVGALGDVAGIAPTFTGIAILGILLGGWALRTPPPAPEGTSTPRELVDALRDSRVAAGMWLIAVPGLLFGTIGVLAPLRFDELGAGAAVIGAAFLAAGALETGVSPVVGRISDRRGRLAPALFGLAAGVLLMLLFTLPDRPWQLFVLVMLAAPLVGTLWAPSMAMVSDGAQALCIAQGLAFALTNVGWSVGQTVGSAASAGLADATSDAVPYLLLSAICATTFLVLVRARRRTAVLT